MLYNGRRSHAGVAQLVERNLAKVKVASSRLVSRSSFRTKREGHALTFPFCQMAGWQNGYAADCKSVYAGSIPTTASIPAWVAKLVDARDLKSLGRKAMPVRVRP